MFVCTLQSFIRSMGLYGFYLTGLMMTLLVVVVSLTFIQYPTIVILTLFHYLISHLWGLDVITSILLLSDVVRAGSSDVGRAGPVEMSATQRHTFLVSSSHLYSVHLLSSDLYLFLFHNIDTVYRTTQCVDEVPISR
ncbi:hypothetical protein BDN70DRAFT_227019 [Pholiota conissans]|uniref:Uncharacterized protein n=1 Tax=Pholiota conissans TaxID=109636 RepID=A0A9P5YVY7_9AGAR|nr:hypothetical protein BDN70DRAFT_227019 [Pholiota conissans]